MRVLVVEDNAALAAVLRFNLERLPAQVTWANTGDRAIGMLDRDVFDIIVTDYQLPGASGDEVIRAARRSERNREVPIILLTAKERELDVERIRDVHSVAAVVPKPFSPRQVTELVRRLTESTGVVEQESRHA